MKKQLLLLLTACFAILVSIQSFAQNNTFPGSGNVGIGTTSPANKLQIEANASGSITASIKNSTTTTNFPQAKFEVLNGAGSSGQFFKAGTNWATYRMMLANDLVVYNGGSGNLVIYNDLSTGNVSLTAGAATSAQVVLLPSGNFGIGTASPSEKLAVNGNILSKKVKVTQTGWSDYVFYPSYKLLPLKEVENYIKLHQHLPDVPSAKEVEAKGLDLGDNQATLLKKIEELTLYMIEMKKENEEMKKEIKVLQESK
jgi:hypothetical protein